MHEDTRLEIMLPAARAVLAGAPSDVESSVRDYLRTALLRIAQATSDEAIRVRWLTSPIGGQLAELAGAAGPTGAGRDPAAVSEDGPRLDEAERTLLRLLTEGRTNAEIATELELGESDVAQGLARLQARLGATSRAEATSLAFRGLAAVGSR
jgi:DNA-binding NarL/FixJ family response regulator